jgi:hypothetical protein
VGSVWSLSPLPLAGGESDDRYAINTPEGCWNPRGRVTPQADAASLAMTRQAAVRLGEMFCPISRGAVSYVRRRAVREE